ncbi:MAG: DUF2059 domain-containing protein [Pseudomonadota bacterium]
MKKLLTALALAGLAFSASSQAQTADPKLEWATKVVALQQGPELDRLVAQLAGSATQDLIANWEPRLQTSVPKARQAKAMEDLNGELKKYSDEVSKIIGDKVTKVSTDTLVPAYMERFTLDELKQISAFFESPVIKKYQGVAPQMGSLFVEKLVEASRTEVVARARQFDESATKIVGTAPAPARTPAAPAANPKK